MRYLGWLGCLVLLAMLSGCSHFGANPGAEWIDPEFESVEQRDARMQWWREARFGMFIHWGVYAVPAGVYQGESSKRRNGEWIMRNEEIPVAEYRAFAESFNPVKYDPEAWVQLAKAAGMKYIVITAKHHDGFALFDSKVTDWDVVDSTPYGKDLLQPLAEACRRHDMPFGLYFSQAQDWVHPGGAKARIKEGEFWDEAHAGDFDHFLKTIAYPQAEEILSRYDIDILWWDTPTWMTHERAVPFRPLLKLQPGLITNDRMGGDFSGDLKTPEQKVPATGLDYDWESCMTMNKTWGYRSDDHAWKSTETLIRHLIDIASKGGNFLLNVGPTAQGEIPPPSIERLQAMGAWLKVNGVAIYGTKASAFRRIKWGRCTQKDNVLYLHIFDWPEDRTLLLPGLRNDVRSARLLVGGQALNAERSGEDWRIRLPEQMPDAVATVVKVELDGLPDVDPRYPVNKADGSFDLAFPWADIEQHTLGEKILFVDDPQGGYIKNWKSSQASVSWAFRNMQPGRYRLMAEVQLSSDRAQALSLTVSLDKESISYPLTTTPASHWESVQFRELEMEEGVHTLLIERAKLEGNYESLQLRNVRLIPIADQ